MAAPMLGVALVVSFVGLDAAQAVATDVSTDSVAQLATYAMDSAPFGDPAWQKGL